MDLFVETTDESLKDAASSRVRAITAATAAIDVLSSRDVKALVTGSLAGGSYHQGSDIDFLIMECPRSLKYAIEADVEDALGGLRFDVIYLDEVSLPAHRESLLRKAVDVRHLS